MKLSKVILGSLFIASSLLASSNTTHWGYTGHEGPSNWGDLDAKYSMCKSGGSQSPINISKSVTVESKGLEEIVFDYNIDVFEVVNNGHTIQVTINDGSSITVDNINFALKQFHFHTPSENQIEGQNFPLEAHFVHASKDGRLAVVAVMFEDGRENAALKKIWKVMPHKEGERTGCGLSQKDLNCILPKDKSYYRFNGSLTTPPCSEGVRWLVMKNYSHISAEQTKKFLEIFHHSNNRPVQPINARKVIE